MLHVRNFVVCIFLCCAFGALAQSYTSFRAGNNQSILANALGGVCLMGGATENDNAMRWFLDRASGGDVLVLRTSGSDGYNAYFYTDLGVTLNSVETIVCNNASASQETYLHQRIQEAEAIWFAGGDQWEYISFWRNTPVDSLIRLAVQTRNVAIGGTSAGMAIQGQAYFTAQNGTITSSQALLNPYASNFTVDTLTFLGIDALNGIITDTHFDNPDRRGRTTAFLGRLLADLNQNYNGIACDEYTAVCIEGNVASVYGDFPAYDDNAYFIAPNCELVNPAPEICSSGNPLEWDLNGQAVKVCRVHGTPNGSNAFSLATWKPLNAAFWFDWSVNNGTFVEMASTEPNCTSNSLSDNEIGINIITKDINNELQIIVEVDNLPASVQLLDISGKLLNSYQITESQSVQNYSNLPAGCYMIRVQSENGTVLKKLYKY